MTPLVLKCMDCEIVFDTADDLLDHACTNISNMSMYCENVREFSQMYADAKGVKLPEVPMLLSPKSVEHISKMVQSELDELEESKTIAEQADALLDAIYYICDMAVRHGINLDKLFDVVHTANMSKGGNDGKVILNEGGKILKPEGFVPPDIAKAIEVQNEDGSWS